MHGGVHGGRGAGVCVRGRAWEVERVERAGGEVGGLGLASAVRFGRRLEQRGHERGRALGLLVVSLSLLLLSVAARVGVASAEFVTAAATAVVVVFTVGGGAGGPPHPAPAGCCRQVAHIGWWPLQLAVAAVADAAAAAVPCCDGCGCGWCCGRHVIAGGCWP